MNAWSFYVKFR